MGQLDFVSESLKNREKKKPINFDSPAKNALMLEREMKTKH